MKMKNHSSKDAYYERLRNLAEVNKVSIKESKTRNLGTLIDYKRASDGVAYGIVKENHQYYIKKSGLKQDPNISDFAYIGGLANITEYQYKSLAEADKNRNMLFATINESLGVKFNKSGKKMVNEDKAAEEINASSEMADDLDAATADAAAADAANDAMATADAAGDAEMAAGLNAEPSPEGDAMPAPEGGDETAPEGDAMPAPEGGDETAPEGDEEGDSELQKEVGKIANEIKTSDLDKSELTWLLKTFIRGFIPNKDEEGESSKNKMTLIDDDDRHEVADMILKVVPDEEIENLGANVEDSEAKAETGLEEEQVCAECGGFGSYAESRGYTKESIMECGEEEIGSLVSGYANAHNDGQNDGDFKMVALLMTPEMLEKLKGDYGHDEYAEKLTPYVNQLGESDEASKAAQIDELWGGIKNLGKAAGAGIKAGAQAVGQTAQAVGQKVGQAATAVKQTYHAGEVPGEIKKLEGIAQDLGKQIAALNSRLQKSGKQPVNMSSILQSITNQLGSKGSASLGKFGMAAEGTDPANTVTQPDMLKEVDEIDEPEDENGEDNKEEIGFAPEADVLGGGVVKPDGAGVEIEEPEIDKKGGEIEIKDSTVNITVNENRGLATKGTGSPKGKGKPFVKEEKPKANLSKEKKVNDVKSTKKDEDADEKTAIDEAEAKLRKYIRARLEEKAGIRKAVIAEGVKTEKVQKLDNLIDAQFALYESKFKKNVDEGVLDYLKKAGAEAGHFIGAKGATKAKIAMDLKNINPNDMNAVNKLFFEVFGKTQIKKAVVPYIKAASAPERYQILTQASQDPDGIGTLAIGSNGKVVYKPYKSVNWGDPGVHIFGAGQ